MADDDVTKAIDAIDAALASIRDRLHQTPPPPDKANLEAAYDQLIAKRDDVVDIEIKQAVRDVAAAASELEKVVKSARTDPIEIFRDRFAAATKKLGIELPAIPPGDQIFEGQSKATQSFLSKTFTVEDPDTRIRREDDLLAFTTYQPGDALPPGKHVGDPKTIPVGTRLSVRGTRIGSNGVIFVSVQSSDAPPVALGWTSSRNLAGKFVNETLGEATPSGDDPKGPNAAWNKGDYIGQVPLVNIVDNKLEIERITLMTLPAYLRLVEEAAKSGVKVVLRSGFRTYTEQEFLYNGFINHLPGFATAAKPGFSNHQHGQAFDLHVGGFDGDPVYDWLKRNAAGLGFIRTVSGEPWHWEYRPTIAAQFAAAGKHKRDGIT